MNFTRPVFLVRVNLLCWDPLQILGVQSRTASGRSIALAGTERLYPIPDSVAKNSSAPIVFPPSFGSCGKW